MINGDAPVLLGFYENARAAKQFEPTAAGNARRRGGDTVRRGAVIILWTSSVPARLRDTTEACAFG